MKIIGITGGVGAGKSTILDYLSQKYDAYVIQADKIGHLVMEPGGLCYEHVIALFGRQIIKNDKTIDRKQVSDVVFGNELMRQSLDAIIHPAVKTYILGGNPKTETGRLQIACDRGSTSSGRTL